MSISSNFPAIIDFIVLNQLVNFWFQASEFRVVQNAFKALDFSDIAIESIWKMVAVILHLGNIEFDSKEDNGESIATIRSSNEIKFIADLLQVEIEDVKQALLTRVIAAMGEVRKRKHISKISEAHFVNHLSVITIYYVKMSFVDVKLSEH